MATTRTIVDILNLPIFTCYGFAAPGEPVNYTHNGVRIHKSQPCFGSESIDLIKPHLKRAEFVSILGNITDEFYGNLNDFNIWFLGKAARNEQFFIIGFVLDGSAVKEVRVNALKIWVGGKDGSFQTFAQMKDMTWCPV